MFLVIGLGNPGIKYTRTRHNVGFMCLDTLSFYYGFPPFNDKFSSLIAEKRLDDYRVILQKPQTFMNLSGEAAIKVVSFFKIEPENIFVIHDDIDMPPFDIKIKFGGGNGGHNGLRNIDSKIGKNYWRIRIGVGRPLSKDEVANYVLSDFYPDEISGKLENLYTLLAQNFKNILFSQEKNSIIKDIKNAI